MSWRRDLELTIGRYQMRALERGMALAAGLRPRRIAAGPLDLAVLERRRAGTPVVAIHGFGGDKETWLLMAPLLRGCPLVLLDLPGHGASTVVGREAASPAAMGKAVVAGLDRLGFDRVHLCGNSMGGGIALWIARHHPARVASLTLVASVAPELAESELTRALARGENILIPGPEDPDRFIKMVTEKPPRVPRAIKRYVAARRAAARPVLEELFRGWVAAAPEVGLPRDLEAIEQPTLVIHGARDRIIHPDTARKVVRRLPRARLELLDGIGHVPQLEAPSVVARLVHRHLQEQR
ncbi:MAG TPA: alpha/beta fold hydrolase [Kofleriaceae bacterium]|nr:alpha/beta fold hydrolase [Kofleriaceae bacterium]